MRWRERERERERESVDKRKGGLPMQSERVSDLKRDRERGRERESVREIMFADVSYKVFGLKCKEVSK